MTNKLTIRGLDDVTDTLNRIAPNQAKNIIRATVHDMAKQVRDDAKDGMPEDEGTMKKATKHKRERMVYGKARSTVRVGPRAFYWRFLEYGQGPDRIAYDFFMKAIHKMRGNMEGEFLQAFGRKFEAALARARKRG